MFLSVIDEIDRTVGKSDFPGLDAPVYGKPGIHPGTSRHHRRVMFTVKFLEAFADEFPHPGSGFGVAMHFLDPLPVRKNQTVDVFECVRLVIIPCEDVIEMFLQGFKVRYPEPSPVFFASFFKDHGEGLLSGFEKKKGREESF
jgi:hypothetical protein